MKPHACMQQVVFQTAGRCTVLLLFVHDDAWSLTPYLVSSSPAVKPGRAVHVGIGRIASRADPVQQRCGGTPYAAVPAEQGPKPSQWRPAAEAKAIDTSL